MYVPRGQEVLVPFMVTLPATRIAAAPANLSVIVAECNEEQGQGLIKHSSLPKAEMNALWCLTDDSSDSAYRGLSLIFKSWISNRYSFSSFMESSY